MLKLAWLGPPVAEVDEVQVHFETRKIAALLAYLSLNPLGSPREKLAALLWPEFDQTHAMANLRRALGSLTRALPAGYLETSRESVRWSENPPMEMDVLKFREMIQAVRAHEHESDLDDIDHGLRACQTCLNILETACELHRGDFLDGLNLSDAPSFDEWQYLTREELTRELAWALEQLAGGLVSQAAPGQSAWEKAATAARRWISLDRLESNAYLALVEIYARAGQRSLAQRQIDEYTRLYREEFGQEPDQDIRASFQNALNQGQPRRGEAKTVPSPPLDNSQVLLKTKLYLPRVKSSRVSRPRLISKLNKVCEYKLTLVSAPAGFGKTSLLVDWSAQTDLLVGWLSLDSEDNDPNRFLSYLCAALDSTQEGIANTARTLLESVQMISPQTVVTVLLKDLEAAAEPVVLVLDDYQFITNPSIHDSLAYFLERAGQNLHLVVASRVDPSLPLARLRIEDDLLEMRTDDLRFTLDESADFFSQVMRLDISPEDIQALVTRTEGWVVGLQMAAISLKGTPNREQFIQTFSGSHRYILEYLIQEVLDRQPEHVRDFLLKTSILDRLCSDLCDVVIGQSPEPAYSTLDYLERSNLFLIPLDQDCHWYRYHHLFADLLRARFQQAFKIQDVIELHTRAAKWYEQNGLTYEAIHHASLTSNDAWVERLIEKNYMNMFRRGEISSTRYLTGKLSKELIYRRPWLCIYEAESHAWFGELGEAEVLLAQAEKQIQSGKPSSDTQFMLGHLAYIKSRVTAMRGDVHQAIELCFIARDNTSDTNPALLAGIGIMLGYGYFLDGDFTNAILTVNETIQLGIKAGVITAATAAYCVLARLFRIRGQLRRAYKLYQEADEYAHKTGGQLLGIMGIVDVGIADVLCEWNDLDAALICIQKGLEFIQFWGKTDDILLAYTTYSRIQQAQGNTAAAVETIEKGMQLLRTSGIFPEAREAVTTAEVRLWLTRGDTLAVRRWSDSFEKDISLGVPLRFGNELGHITLARVYIAQKRFHEAIGLLSRLESGAQSGGRTGRLIEILNLQALALQALSQPAQALEVLAKSLALAEPEGYARVYLDSGEPMQQLLFQFTSIAPAGPIRDYAIRLQ